MTHIHIPLWTFKLEYTGTLVCTYTSLWYHMIYLIIAKSNFRVRINNFDIKSYQLSILQNPYQINFILQNEVVLVLMISLLAFMSENEIVHANSISSNELCNWMKAKLLEILLYYLMIRVQKKAWLGFFSFLETAPHCCISIYSSYLEVKSMFTEIDIEIQIYVE